jgi:hypothetical protein
MRSLFDILTGRKRSSGTKHSGKALKYDSSALSDLKGDLHRKLRWFGVAIRKYSELTETQKQRIHVQLNTIKHNFNVGDMIEWTGNLFRKMDEISRDLDNLNDMLSGIGSDPEKISATLEFMDSITKKLSKQEEYARLVRLHILNNIAVRSAMGETGPFMMYPYYLQSLKAAKDYLAKIEEHLRAVRPAA